MKKFFIGFLFVLSLILTSCTVYEDIDVKRYDNFNVENLMNKNEPLKLIMDITVENPNPYNLTLKDADLSVFVGSNDLGKVKLDKKVTFPRKSTSTKRVVLIPSDRKILQKALAGSLSIFTKGKITVKIDGRVKGKAFGVGKWFDVSHKEDINPKDFF